MRKKKFCLVAISGNEERWAKGWAESVMKLKPDQVVFNLTAYDDKTEEIIRSIIPADILTLIKHPWTKNFSEARNYCFEYVHDSIDYCGYLDLDEVWTDESYKVFNEIMSDDKFPHSFLLVNIYNTMNQNDSMLASLFYPRIWPHKTNEGVLVNEKFEGSVHNQLFIDEKFGFQGIRTPLAIMHYGYALNPEEMKRKHARSEELLRGQVEKNNDDFFAHLNLAQLLRAKGDMKGALNAAINVLRIVDPKIKKGDYKLMHSWIMSKEQKATCYIALGEYEKAKIEAQEILERKPDHLDSLMNLANSYLMVDDRERARFWLKRYLFTRKNYDEQRDNTNIILNHLNSSFVALYHLGVLDMLDQRFAQAQSYFKKCYEMEPNYRDVFVKYINSLRLLGKHKEMESEVQTYMSSNPQKAYIVYEFFGDVELESTNVESAKFNYYQAMFMSEDKPDHIRVKTKYDNIIEIFGEVSESFFDTQGKQSNLLKQVM